MTADPAVSDLRRRVETLLPQGDSIDPRDIVEAVRCVMSSVSGDVAAVNVDFYREIKALGQFLDEVKAEIAALRPDEITAQHLPTAADELEAIVGSTENATNSIFEAVEAIEELAGEMDPAVAGKVTAEVTKVYEACSFQDITGQRISKVVNALQHVENKVRVLLEAFGHETDGAPARQRGAASERADGKPKRPDEHLMSGPALPDEGVSQDDIDALLNSMD